MNQADLESVYEHLATTLDAVPEETRELYLAKLALLFSNALNDAPRARVLITEAAQNLSEAST